MVFMFRSQFRSVQAVSCCSLHFPVSKAFQHMHDFIHLIDTADCGTYRGAAPQW